MSNVKWVIVLGGISFFAGTFGGGYMALDNLVAAGIALGIGSGAWIGLIALIAFTEEPKEDA